MEQFHALPLLGPMDFGRSESSFALTFGLKHSPKILQNIKNRAQQSEKSNDEDPLSFKELPCFYGS